MLFLSNRAAMSAAIALSLSGQALADEGSSLGPVVVTANRQETTVAEALASVTVLTRADIEQSQAPDLPDLLARQAGIDIARSGGPGQASTIFLRGGNSGHALVLVDGIRVNPATQGAIDFAHIPLGQIERIEIVRGPRAALWGSDAIGGVIQIFTRDPSRPFVELHAGSYGRAGAGAGAGISNQRSRGGIVLGEDRLHGFSATNKNYPYGDFPDDDGYRNRNLSLRGQVTVGAQQLTASGLLTSADVEFDEGRTAALNRVGGIGLSGALSARWSHALTLGHSSEDLDTPVYGSRFGSSRTSLDWVNTVTLDPRNTLNVGINWSREAGYSDEAFSGGFQASRRNAALFASWRVRLDTHLLDLSVRRDENSQFAGATTANLAWGWQAAPNWRLRASWGQGFRAPDFNELYYPGFFGLFAGNADLQPERSNSAEIGAEWSPSVGQRLGLSAYRTRVDQLIAFDGPNFKAVNIDRAAIDGLELEYRWHRGGASLEGNASWLDARDADSGERLLRRAPRKASISANYKFGNRVAMGLDLSAFSARPDVGAVQLPGYARLDYRISALLDHGWSVEGRIENLGDRDYQLIDGYSTPGRSGMLNVRWNTN